MSFDEFIASFKQEIPPDMTMPLTALWFDGKDEWEQAHDLVDSAAGQDAARIHAYLHRKEGDSWNADYWYRKAGTRRPQQTLQEEWTELVKLHLESNS